MNQKTYVSFSIFLEFNISQVAIVDGSDMTSINAVTARLARKQHVVLLRGSGAVSDLLANFHSDTKEDG